MQSLKKIHAWAQMQDPLYHMVHRYYICHPNLSRVMRFPTMCNVQFVKGQTSLRICAVWSEPLLVV